MTEALCRGLFSDESRPGKNAKTKDRENWIRRLEECAPHCACEVHLVSPHSPGPVTDDEDLLRLHFSNQTLSSSDIEAISFNMKEELFKGLSVFRMAAADSEIADVIAQRLARGKDEWVGVSVLRAGCIREVERPLEAGGKAFCVFDTAENNIIHHAEVLPRGIPNEYPQHPEHQTRNWWKERIVELLAKAPCLNPTEFRNGTVSHLVQCQLTMQCGGGEW